MSIVPKLIFFQYHNLPFDAGSIKNTFRGGSWLYEVALRGVLAVSSSVAIVLFCCFCLLSPRSWSLPAVPWPRRMTRGWECCLVWYRFYHQTASHLGCDITAESREVEFGVWYRHRGPVQGSQPATRQVGIQRQEQPFEATVGPAIVTYSTSQIFHLASFTLAKPSSDNRPKMPEDHFSRLLIILGYSPSHWDDRKSPLKRFFFFTKRGR